MHPVALLHFTVLWLAVKIAATPSLSLLPRNGQVPVIAQDFPDPDILQDESSLKWYAYATNENNKINVQVATAPSLSGPWNVLSIDALPTVGAWSTGKNVWAPSVRRVADGSYVLYYAAEAASDSSRHCIGTATSSQITGPFTPLSTPLACALSLGGAIDPAGFTDTDGTNYVVYKIDGNSIGHGGSCGNTVSPIVSTPLMLQKLASNGVTAIGNPVQVLDRGDADGPLIEAPFLLRTAGGVYILFFSSNCYDSKYYDISYATASSVLGPYTKSSAPLLQTPDYGLLAPGGVAATPDGKQIIFHAYCGGSGGNPTGPRCMYERNLQISCSMLST